jgi:hypothetical protein
MLGVLLHAPRGPFYSPKAARSRWEHSRKAILAFCRLAHRTLSGADFFPVVAQPTVEDPEPLAHRTLSGAHQTVRCPFWLLALPRVARGLRDRPLARSTVGSPDSLVHHRTVRWFIVVRRRRSPESSQFARASLAHRTLIGAPPDSPVRPDCAESWLLSQVFTNLVFSCF